MPPAVGTAIAGIVGGLATMKASHDVAKSTDAASRIQADYNNRALAAAQEEQQYERKQKADYRARLDSVVNTSNQQVAGLYGRPAPSTAPITAAPQQQTPLFPSPDQASAAPMPSAPAATVNMRSPGPMGSVRPVPADQVAHWEARGAVRV